MSPLAHEKAKKVESHWTRSDRSADQDADYDEQNQAEEKPYPARDCRIYLYPAILVVPITARIEISEGSVEPLNVDFAGGQARQGKSRYGVTLSYR